MTEIEYLQARLKECALAANRLTVKANGEDIATLNEVSNLLIQADVLLEKICVAPEE